MKKDLAQYLFQLLDESDISYLLLRPCSLDERFTDIDLVIPEKQFLHFLDILMDSDLEAWYQPTAYNRTSRIIVEGLILDVQFELAFMPRKSFRLRDSLPYSKVSFERDPFLYPEVSEEVLFTFWLLHLLLDKPSVEQSSTFKLFNEEYLSTWQHMLSTPFCDKWMQKIFGNQKKKALQLINGFFSNGFQDRTGQLNRNLRSLVIKNRPWLLITRFYDELRFRMLRIFGAYNKQWPLQTLHKKLAS